MDYQQQLEKVKVQNKFQARASQVPPQLKPSQHHREMKEPGKIAKGKKTISSQEKIDKANQIKDL